MKVSRERQIIIWKKKEKTFVKEIRDFKSSNASYFKRKEKNILREKRKDFEKEKRKSRL